MCCVNKRMHVCDVCMRDDSQTCHTQIHKYKHEFTNTSSQIVVNIILSVAGDPNPCDPNFHVEFFFNFQNKI